MVNCLNQAAQFGLTKSTKILVPLVDEYMAKGTKDNFDNVVSTAPFYWKYHAAKYPGAKKFVDAFSRSTRPPAVERRRDRVRRHLHLQDGGRESRLDRSRPRSIAVLESTKFQFTKEQEWYRKEDHQGVNSCLVLEGIPREPARPGRVRVSRRCSKCTTATRSSRRSPAWLARWNRRRPNAPSNPTRAGALGRRPVSLSIAAFEELRGSALPSHARRPRPRPDLRRDRGRPDDHLRDAAPGQFRARRVLRDRCVRRAASSRSGSALGWASSPRRSPSRCSRSLLDRLVLRSFYDKEPTAQLLVTFGIALVVEESLRLIFGATTQQYPMPAALAGLVSRSARSSIPRTGCCSRPASS